MPRRPLLEHRVAERAAQPQQLALREVHGEKPVHGASPDLLHRQSEEVACLPGHEPPARVVNLGAQAHLEGPDRLL